MSSTNISIRHSHQISEKSRSNRRVAISLRDPTVMVAISADMATITQLSRNDTARILQLWDLAVISTRYNHDFQ
jgi:hypothetical protein